MGQKAVGRFRQKVCVRVCTLCPSLHESLVRNKLAQSFSDCSLRSNEAKSWARGGWAKSVCLYSHTVFAAYL